MMIMMIINCIWDMVDQQKVLRLIYSQGTCPRLSTFETLNNPRAGF